MRRTAILFSLGLVLPLAADTRGQEDVQVLEAALRNPPATGLLVTFVGEGSQAMEAGVRVGDVIVSYAGAPTPTIEALNARKDEVMGEESIAMVVFRQGGELEFTLLPGMIGINGAAVTRGVPPAPLPEPTGVTFDFSSVGEQGDTRWYEFLLGGEKAGYECWTLKRSGDRLFLVSEVGFDGGEEFGPEHMKVVLAMTAEKRPDLVFCRFENVLNGWTAVTRVDRPRPGVRRLFSRWWMGEDSGGNDPVRAARDLVPTYFIETLARFMPREVGACFHFRPLQEGFGVPSLRSALVCAAEEEVSRGGETVPAYRYEWRDVAGTVSAIFWVSADGEIVRADWSGAQGVLSTREKALQGVPPELAPAGR